MTKIVVNIIVIIMIGLTACKEHASSNLTFDRIVDSYQVNHVPGSGLFFMERLLEEARNQPIAGDIDQIIARINKKDLILIVMIDPERGLFSALVLTENETTILVDNFGLTLTINAPAMESFTMLSRQLDSGLVQSCSGPPLVHGYVRLLVYYSNDVTTQLYITGPRRQHGCDLENVFEWAAETVQFHTGLEYYEVSYPR